jgi:hypothetical protein
MEVTHKMALPAVLGVVVDLVVPVEPEIRAVILQQKVIMVEEAITMRIMAVEVVEEHLVLERLLLAQQQVTAATEPHLLFQVHL